MSEDNNIQNLEEKRRQKAKNFTLNIHDDILDEPAEPANNEPQELNSYSGEDVKAQMAKDSKQALKKKKKLDKKLSKAKNKRNRRVFRLIWAVSVLIVGAMAGMFFVAGIDDMLAINRTENKSVKIEIPANPNLDTVATVLEKNNIIEDKNYFKMFAKFTKADDDFTQGTYEIKTNMDYEAIINFLLSSVNRTDTVKVTIPEGRNVLEIAKLLKEKGALADEGKFLELCNSNQFDDEYSFLRDIKNTDDRYYKLEGYLYPDTYTFYKNEDAENVIYRFLNNYDTRLTEKQDVSGYDKVTTIEEMLKKNRSNYTLDQVMIVASIIQSEAADTDDMYYISSIIYNRLNSEQDMGVQYLGLDSTKFYPYRTQADVPDDARDTFESSYDTYTKEGLPAGEICNPGMNAIIAALNPKDTNYYFFCHDKDGNAYYASTIYEHNENLANIE